MPRVMGVTLHSKLNLSYYIRIIQQMINKGILTMYQ